tara:strand:+ start:442 stop:2226 length:1785 start_codon:yes stop_codon:yes gene_type:complete
MNHAHGAGNSGGTVCANVLAGTTLKSCVVTSSLTTVGALNSGSISCGFGAIDNGSSAITTTGLISGGSLDIDNVLINGTTIGHTCDTDLMTVADASLTIKGDITVGVDDTGHDVKFFGAAAGAFMLYDQSCDLLEIRGATAAGPGHLKLTTGEATVVANDVLGKIEFQAPAETGTDAVKVSATIAAVAQGTFAACVNATDLILYTAHDCGVAERFRFTSQNEIGIAGANYGTDGQVLTSGGAGAAVAWEDAGGGVVSGGTDNAILRADGTGGSTSQGSGVTIADTTGDITLPAAGQIFVGNGSAGDPSYTFICDTDVGFYRAAGNELGVSTNGTARFLFKGEEFHIGDCANGKMTVGLNIEQGGADDEIFALKSSDVAHGVTCLTETDTFFSIRKGSGSQGGAYFRIGSDGTTGWRSQVIVTGCANTSKDSGAVGIIDFRSGRANGTGYQAVNSNGNLMTLTCYDGTNNYKRFIWDAEGSAHAEVEWTTFDDYCDIELLRGVHGAMTPCYAPSYKDKFGQDMVYNLEKYEDLGLVGENSMHWETREDGRIQLRGMVNTTSMMMLHHSTIIQMADKFNARLDGLETQLKALSEGK